MAKKGPKPFEPTDEQRKTVERAAAVGMTAEQTSKLIGIGETTLWKYFGDELSKGGLKANMNVAGALYQSAMKGNVTAQIFWCKTRLGWKEISQTELTGKNGAPLTPVFHINVKSND